MFERRFHAVISWRGGFLLVLSALLLACGDGGASIETAEHPWLNPPPAPIEGAVDAPPWSVFPVADTALAEAVSELETEPYIQISPGMASHFAGQEVRVPAEMRPFLVRGLMPPGARLSVVQFAGGLWLKASGGEPAAAVASPRVVLVDPTPRDIFITLENE